MARKSNRVRSGGTIAHPSTAGLALINFYQLIRGANLRSSEGLQFNRRSAPPPGFKCLQGGTIQEWLLSRGLWSLAQRP
jgi:hypothetical protein